MKKLFFLMAGVVAMCTMFACGNATKASEDTDEAAVDTVLVEDVEVEADTLAVDTLVVE